jgi:hypothetical protein
MNTPRTDAVLAKLIDEAREQDGYVLNAVTITTLQGHARQLERELETLNKKFATVECAFAEYTSGIIKEDGLFEKLSEVCFQ